MTDFIILHLRVLVLERKIGMNQTVHKAAERPDVTAEAVRLALDDLRSDVVLGSNLPL